MFGLWVSLVGVKGLPKEGTSREGKGGDGTGSPFGPHRRPVTGRAHGCRSASPRRECPSRSAGHHRVPCAPPFAGFRDSPYLSPPAAGVSLRTPCVASVWRWRIEMSFPRTSLVLVGHRVRKTLFPSLKRQE